MIKARAHRDDGTSIMLLGLSNLNLQKLQAGLPIAFDGKPFGYDGEVIIVWGETEQAIVDALRGAGVQLPEEQVRDA